MDCVTPQSKVDSILDNKLAFKKMGTLRENFQEQSQNSSIKNFFSDILS